MMEHLGILLFSFLMTYIFSYFLIPRLKRSGIVGKDMNKPDTPEIPEMGGIAIVVGFTAGILLAVFLNTFFSLPFNLVFILASLITILSISIIGVMDDLLNLPQWLKALLPLGAAIPLVAIKAAGSTIMVIPFFGPLDLGILYIILLIPIGVAVASNLTNMFAGFNGLESGMGSVIFLAISIFALMNGRFDALIIFLPMLGALLAFSVFNFHPAKVFPGDVGNLTIGAALAAGVIIGNIEAMGALLLLLYVFDFFIKLLNKFPSRDWWGFYKYGKLYPVENKVRGLAQYIMKSFNGISERNLVLFFIGLEILLAIILIGFFYFLNL